MEASVAGTLIAVKTMPVLGLPPPLQLLRIRAARRGTKRAHVDGEPDAGGETVSVGEGQVVEESMVIGCRGG